MGFDADATSDKLKIDDGILSFTGNGATCTYNVTTGVADADLDGQQLVLSNMNFFVGDDLVLRQGAVFVNDGSDVFAGDVVTIATNANVAVLVNGSTFNFNGQVRLGNNGFVGSIALQNESVGSIGGDLDLIRDSEDNLGGFIDVLSGSALVTSGRVLVGDMFTGTSTGLEAIVTVVGTDSFFVMNGANNLRVGDSMFDNLTVS